MRLKLLPLLCVCFAVTLNAQVQTNGTAVGFPEGGHFTGSEVESVQTNNGNLHVNIPLWSLPGRGVSTAASFVYDSKGWYIIAYCPDTGADCSYSVAPELGNTMQMAILRSTDYKASGGISAVRQICHDDLTKYNLGSNYTIREPNGTKHHFVPDPLVTNAAADVPCWNRPQDTSSYADDGSGFMSSNYAQVSKSGGLPGAWDTNGNSATTIDTLGRSIATDGSYYDSQGQLHHIQVTTETVTISTHLCGSALQGLCGEVDDTWTVPHIIVLPNGLKYTIEYVQNDEGEISSITLPTGATISYTYTPSPAEDHGGKRVQTRTVTVGGQSSQWTYSYTPLGAVSGAIRTTTVTDPNQNQTVYTCTSAYSALYTETANPPNNGPVVLDPPCVVSKEQYYDSANHLLKTVDIAPSTWSALPQSVTTSWAKANQVSKIEYDYESMTVTLFPDGTYGPQTAPISWGNVTEKREYGYGTGAPGALLRKTDYAYLHTDTTVNPNANHAQYLAANIADRPTSEIVRDGSGTVVAQTKYYYDEGSLTSTSSTPAVNHDYTNFSTANMIRGNLTRVSRWNNATNTWLDTRYAYDDLGNKRTVTDPKGNVTTYDYTDSFSGASCNTAGSPTYAFPTTITDPTPFSFQTKDLYYQCTGQLQSSRDQNDINNSRSGTTYTYDLVNRLVSTSYPDGGMTTTNFGGNAGNSYQDPLPLTATMTKLATPSPTITASVQYDGLGRQSVQVLPNGATVETTYDLLGRVYSIGNPHFGATTDGTIYKYYDPLGRIAQQTQQDHSNLWWCYDGFQTNSQTNCHAQAGNSTNGTWVDASDEVGVDWQRTSDAFGQLRKVMELGTTATPLNLETDYTYNTLDDLASVNQIGNSTNGDTARATRSFTYDSLSRLIQAYNPESNYTCYGTTPGGAAPNGSNCTSGYDANGNLSAKTDASGTSIFYNYDVLNRLTGKTYSDSTQPVAYTYDESSPSWAGGYQFANTIGRLSSTSVGGVNIYSRYGYSYDAMGRLRRKFFMAPNAAGNGLDSGVGAGGDDYDLAGNVIFTGEGPGIYLFQTRDAAGRVTTVTSDAGTTAPLNGVNSTTIFANAIYTPSGALSTRLLGNGLTETKTYDNRERVTSVTQNQTGSTVGYSTSVGYATNGNVAWANDSVNGNWIYSYDSLNRLRGASSSVGLNLSWFIDPFGNRQSQSVSGTGSAPQVSFPSTGNDNRVDPSTGVSYYPTGTVRVDNLGQSYVYDAEGRISSVAMYTGGTATYKYDSEGQLIYENGSNGIQIFQRNSAGQPVWIHSPAGASGPYYTFGAYIDGEQIGSWQNLGFLWAGKDWLGTKRYETVGEGDIASAAFPGPATLFTNLPSSFTSLPFGDALSSIGLDPTHFTGKERDTESGLDNFGARYYSSTMGRWMSPDWAQKAEPVPYAKLDNPQSLNLYGYVLNNPLSHADADGHCCESDFNSFSDHPGKFTGGSTPLDAKFATAVGGGALTAASFAIGVGEVEATGTGAWFAVKTFVKVLSVTGSGVAAVTTAVGAATGTDVSKATDMTTNVTNPVAGAAALATKNAANGPVAADLANIAGAAAGVATGKGVGNPAGVAKSISDQRSTISNAVSGAVSTLKGLFAPPPPAPPAPEPPGP